MTKQLTAIENIGKYNEQCMKYYEEKDFEQFEKYYQKTKSALKTTLPLENTIKQARVIENLYERVKQNGKNFDLSQAELDLAQKLVY